MATSSCEPWRTSAYSEDLRWRIVWRGESLGHSSPKIARDLNISESIATVRRILNIFQATGNVSKRPYPVQNAFRMITEPAKLFIIHLTLQKPGIFLQEITDELRITLGIEVSTSAVCKVLKKAGFTRQRLAVYALQRDDFLRQQYVADVSLYARHTLLFIDETGTDARDAVRHHVYSIRGKPLKAQKLLVRGEHISALAAMSVEGIVALKIVRGGVDGDAYYDFICSLLPHFMPYNGTNKHSVVICDNCSIHHVEEVDQVCRDASVLTLPTPLTTTR